MTRETEPNRTDRSTATGTPDVATGETTPNAATGGTMADVSHTNPYTGRSVGQLFSRGPIVRADGGPAPTDDAVDDAAEPDDPVGRADGPIGRMRDVSHTPPKDAEGANRVFERGTESSRDRQGDTDE